MDAKGYSRIPRELCYGSSTFHMDFSMEPAGLAIM